MIDWTVRLVWLDEDGSNLVEDVGALDIMSLALAAAIMSPGAQGHILGSAGHGIGWGMAQS